MSRYSVVTLCLCFSLLAVVARCEPSTNITASANATQPVQTTSSVSNDTRPDASTSYSADELSRSSVFSTFLALWLCCLTQPYGSLLFVRKAGWYWRLSPISSLFETIVIFSCLLFGRSSLDSELTSSSQSNWLTRSGRGWRTTGAALSLLRSGKYPPSNQPDLEILQRDLEPEHNWRLQAWTTTTVIFLFVKLCVVRGAPVFTVIGFSYTLAWLSVQVLLLLTYWKPFSDTELSEVLSRYERFSTASSSSQWTFYVLPWVIINALLLVGLSMWGLFGSNAGPRTRYVLDILPIMTAITAASGDEWQKRGSRTRADAIYTIVFTCVLMGLVLAGFIACWDTQCAPIESDSFFPALGKILFRFINFWGTLMIIMFIIFAIGFSVICAGFGKSMERTDASSSTESTTTRRRGLDMPPGGQRVFVNITNFAVFVFGTVYYLCLYDPSGTYRPGWLDWIGM